MFDNGKKDENGKDPKEDPKVLNDHDEKNKNPSEEYGSHGFSNSIEKKRKTNQKMRRKRLQRNLQTRKLFH